MMKKYMGYRPGRCVMNRLSHNVSIFLTAVFCIVVGGSLHASEKAPLRIMPLGDSITAGYTDNSKWDHPFEFGYRSGLYQRMKKAGHRSVLVGESKEPLNKKYGDPTHGGSVTPKFDLRNVKQDGHRGYGGWGITRIQKNVAKWIKQDHPDVILLLIGINGINANSSKQLDSLVKTIYATDKDVKLIVAQITPLSKFNQNLFDYNTYIRETLVPTYAGKGCTITTVDLYKLFLSDADDPKSIDAARLSNRINHPTNKLYDKMAESWFQGIKTLLTNKKRQTEQSAR
jgi:lysophospholipase L1-like esterase